MAENCWEFWECKGRFCPVYECGDGRCCWNTTSMEKFRVSGADRSRNCRMCPWYQKHN